MPGNVAVDQPRTRIVSFERNGDKAAGGEENNVAARGVVEFEIELGWIEALVGLLEECEVMSVKMYLEGSLILKLSLQ